VREVELTPQALADLQDLSLLIEKDGGKDRADGYLARLRRRIAVLETFSVRAPNTRRTRRGLQILGFDHRVTIFYRATRSGVQVVRILYAGRQP
jgi:plasmid stabilization system protein ParE